MLDFNLRLFLFPAVHTPLEEKSFSFDQTAQVAESRVIGSEIEFILKKMMGDP